MASYSYKELCYQIPEHINKAFVDEFKREPDGDPGYDGDYWTLAAMYVEDLIKQRDELLAALESASAKMKKAHSDMFEQCLSNSVKNAWGNPVDVSSINDLQLEALIADKLISKAKGGAA